MSNKEDEIDPYVSTELKIIADRLRRRFVDPSEEELLAKLDESGQAALRHAHLEADGYNHNYLGAEHFLLGFLRPRDDSTLLPAGEVLQEVGVSYEHVRSIVDTLVGQGDRIFAGRRGLAPSAKTVFILGAKRAEQDGRAGISDLDILHGIAEISGEMLIPATTVFNSLGIGSNAVTSTIAARKSPLPNP